MNDADSSTTRIRRATVEDAAAIAEVHIRSWQWAYRGLLPDEYLDALDETLGQRQDTWRRVLADQTSTSHTWVVEQAGRVVGFASAGPSRDDDAMPETGEIAAIYLLQEVAGRGLGRALFGHVVGEL